MVEDTLSFTCAKIQPIEMLLGCGLGWTKVSASGRVNDIEQSVCLFSQISVNTCLYLAKSETREIDESEQKWRYYDVNG